MTEEQMKKKVDGFIKDEKRIIKKHKIKKIPFLLFKQKKVPLLCKLAVWIIQKYEAKIDFQFLSPKK